jgi:hypothetical protein
LSAEGSAQRGRGGGGAGGGVFSPVVIIVLVLVGIFAFSAFVTLSAYAPDSSHDLECRANVYSKCAIGFAGLEEAIAEDGAQAPVISRSTLAKGRTEGLLIATPEAGGGADIGALGFDGPVLVILPKWGATPSPDNPSWGMKGGLIPTGDMPLKDLLDTVHVNRRAGAARPTLTGADGTPLAGLYMSPGSIDQLQTMTADGWIPVITDETGAVVMAEAPSSRIFVLADPDLLNTQGLGDLDTFAVGSAIVRDLRNGDGPVIFDVTLNGYKTERNPLRLLFDPPFLAVTLCLAGALALAGVQSVFRFGAIRRPQRVLALGKEALTDNSAQLIRLARRETKMAPGYAALTQKAVAKAVAAPRELSGQALTDFLDRLAAQRGLPDRLNGLTAEAGQVGGRTALTQLAGRLYRWRLEMTRERQ